MKTLIVEKNKIRNNLDAIKAAAGKAEIDAFTPQYIARISAWKGEIAEDLRQELSNMSGFTGMGVRNGMFTEESALVKAVKAALEATSSAVKHY